MLHHRRHRQQQQRHTSMLWLLLQPRSYTQSLSVYIRFTSRKTVIYKCCFGHNMTVKFNIKGGIEFVCVEAGCAERRR